MVLDNGAHRQHDREAHPLSPQSPDVAISSFSSFHSVAMNNNNLDVKRIVSHPPPSFIQQAQSNSSNISLMEPLAHSAASDSDDLFAKALSPRTPDLPRSPFSFSPSEILASK